MLFSLALLTSACYAEKPDLLRLEDSATEQKTEAEQSQKLQEQLASMPPEQKYLLILSMLASSFAQEISKLPPEVSLQVSNSLKDLIPQEANKLTKLHKDTNQKFKSIKQDAEKKNENCDNQLIAAYLDFQAQVLHAGIKIESTCRKAIIVFSQDPKVMNLRNDIREEVDHMIETEEAN